MTDEELKPLAKNLITAVLAYRLGISMQYAYKRYVTDDLIDARWIDLARVLIEGDGVGH